jgi:RNA polymerase sigma-70 factor (ECF subfamily)
VDVHHAPAPAEVRDELRQRGERLLEEDRDVLGRQALDRDPVAVRALADGLARPEEVDHPSPVERGDRGVDELASEVLGPMVVEEDGRDLLVADEPLAIEDGQVLGIGSHGPRPDGLRVAAGRTRQRLDGEAGRAGVAERREQAQLDAEVDQPGPVEPAEAVDQVVEAVVERHRRPIVAWQTVASGYRWDANRRPAATDGVVARFCEAMDTDSQLIVALASDLDGSFEALVLAHQDRVYSIALRMLGDPSDAEEAAQDAFVRAYRALRGYDPARIRDLRLRAWLATIVLNLCRSRIGRRVTAGGRPLSLDAAPPGTMEPAAAEDAGPVARALRGDAATRWADLLLTLPPAYRSAVVLRHVDGLSYPEVATALDRPEGTVKAQVHRGLALLRTAFEAAERREHEEMTA